MAGEMVFRRCTNGGLKWDSARRISDDMGLRIIYITYNGNRKSASRRSCGYVCDWGCVMHYSASTTVVSRPVYNVIIHDCTGREVAVSHT